MSGQEFRFGFLIRVRNRHGARFDFTGLSLQADRHGNEIACADLECDTGGTVNIPITSFLKEFAQ